KEFEEQSVQIRMDEARLRQQFLRRPLVEGHRVRREVREDLDPHTHFLATSRMDRQAFEIEEDLDMVLRELDSQLFAAVDMRGAVIIAIDGDITVRMQLRRFPLAAVVLDARQGFESGSLDLLEPFAARDTKAAVGLLVDAFDADHERAIDLGDRSKSGVAEAEAKISAKDFDESLADRLILRLSDTSRNDSRGKMRG